MPQARNLRSFSFPDYAFNDDAAPVIFESPLTFTKTLPALVAAQTDGALGTRTDADTGIVQLATGHGILTADVVDVYWVGGVRYGMDATVATNDVTIDGGAGDNLPAQDFAIAAVVKQIDWEVNFDGDDAQIVGVFYRNPNDIGANAHLDLRDTGSATIEELDLVHEKANGGLDHITNIAAGDTNIYTGNRIEAGKVSHDSLFAGTVYVLVGLVAA
jgi:hypothetical protein